MASNMLLRVVGICCANFGLFVLMQLSVATVYAQDVCAPYYGKGYCTDYVKQKTGISQRGDGGSWPSNMPKTEVARGDVAILRAHNHVAYVEEVTKRDSNGQPMEIRVSEMNWGRGLREGTPSECVVTSNFGVRTERKISVSQADYMRPGGYTQTQKPSKPSACNSKVDADRKVQALNKEIRGLEKDAKNSKDRALDYKRRAEKYLAEANVANRSNEKSRLKSKASDALEKSKLHLEDASNYLKAAQAKRGEAEVATKNSRQGC